MIVILAYIAIAYLAVQLLVAFANLAGSQFLRPSKRVVKGLPVSVLVPARNEEQNIGHLLNDLSALDEISEILVYDDLSTDSTARIINEKAKADIRIRYINGEKLPGGWLGKNFACDFLSRQAKGDYLLFMDADVRVTKNLLCDALALMLNNNLSLLSLFPVQIMKSFSEWATVPLMNRILVGNLPLALVRKSKFPAFSAANGQFMMFRADVYKRHWYHELFKDEKVEDIRIIREMKKEGYRVQTLLSGGQVSCRMYRTFGEAMNGFAKNIFAILGRSWFILFLYVFITTSGPFAVWMVFGLPGLAIYAASVALTHSLISFQSHQSVLINLAMMPVQQTVLILLSIFSAYKHATGRMTWKGRRI